MTQENPATVPVFCAIDTTDLAQARQWIAAAAAAGMGVKLGKEIVTAHGPRALADLLPAGVPLFLDLKFHDIPNTVAGAVRAAAEALKPWCLTIHAAGGRAMIAAAVAAANQTAARPRILAVTVLTSLDAGDLADIGVAGSVEDQVLRLGRLAQSAGAPGLVCAASEIAPLRRALGPDMLLVVPGIRPAEAAGDDQKRTMTPVEALRLGASRLVIGRPITAAADPVAAARAIAADIADAAA